MRAIDLWAIFASILMFEKIPNFLWKYFFGRSKDGDMFFRRNLKSQGISLRFPLCNNKEIPWGFEISPKKSCPQLWIDRKNIFWKSWKFFRPSRSKQNLLADRMEALSASESHFQTFPQKILFFFLLGTENRVPTFWDYSKVHFPL